MADTSATHDVDTGILEAAKTVRALSKRTIEFSAADVIFLCADPILTALGWDARDPRQVRRVDGGTTRLIEADHPALLIRAVPMNEALPDSAPEAEEGVDWTVVTNGLRWNIYHTTRPDTPFREINLETTATAKEALPGLSLLTKGEIRKGKLAQAWAGEAVGIDIEKALARHLQKSEALLAALREDLGRTSSVDNASLEAALDKLVIRIGETPVNEIVEADAATQQAAAPEVEAETEKSSQDKPARKTATKKAPAKKAAAKTAGKGKTSRKAPEPSPDLPKSPSEMTWPDGATHTMHRKKTIAFIKYDKKTDHATLLPGSLLTPVIGKSLNPTQVEAREQSVEDGSLEDVGGLLKVTTPMQFDNPRLAATFAAGTLVKDISAWHAKNGRPIAGSKAAATSGRGKAKAASAEDEVEAAANSNEEAQPATAAE